jgi:NADH dehydrogenase
MPRNVVTGAFSYTGRYIAQRLLESGEEVITLTGHPNRAHPFGEAITAYPLDFTNPSALSESMQGCDTLYNTYWIRFSRGQNTYERAVSNTRTLVGAAERAGVRRIVHISIANPSIDSPLPYYKGKAEMEMIVEASSMSHAIVRPTLVFGREDVLINNMAWLLRRFPIFPVASGDYRVQPIFVGDVAKLAVDAGRIEGNTTFDAAGPETFRFDEMARLIGQAVGSRARVIHLPPRVVHSLGWVLGLFLRDILLTWNEMLGLRGSLLVSHEPPQGETRFTAWLREHGQELGRTYSSEVRKHF